MNAGDASPIKRLSTFLRGLRQEQHEGMVEKSDWETHSQWV